MPDGDLLHRFLFEELPVRGHLVRLDASWRAAIEHQDYPRAVRGVARHPGVPAEASGVAGLCGRGQLAVTIEQEGRADNYQGVVPLEEPELSGCLERYFERSEQLPSRLLLRIFPEDDIRLFTGTPVWFQCSCSRERVAGILQALGEDEVQSLLRERDDVEVRCQFCNRAWRFDAVGVTGLFSGGSHPGMPPGLH